MIEGISIEQVPDSWRYVQLGSFCDFAGGTQPPKSTFKDAPGDGYVRLLQIRDFETDKYAVYVPASKKLRIIESSDISIARYGASVGRILKGKRGAINVAIMTTYPDGTQVDKNYLGFTLQHPDFQFYLKGLGGRAAQAGFNRGEVSRFKFPLPPFPEQRKIAGVMTVVQQAIEQQELLLQLTTELKKTLLHQLFTHGLHDEHQKQTEIGPVPVSWEVVKIGSLGKVVTGTTPKTKVPEYYSPPEVDFIAPADLGQTRQIYNSGKKISRRGLDVIRALPKEAVMCVCIGSSIGKVGMTSKADSATNQQINTIICNERHDPAFIYYLLSYFSEYWRSFATFGPVPILNKGAFEVINFAIPATKNEEVEIAQCFTALDAKIEVYMRRKALLTNLFRTLLHQLMTAQIRVNYLELPWEWRNETSLYGNLPLSSQ